jgi:hypothetical protein
MEISYLFCVHKPVTLKSLFNLYQFPMVTQTLDYQYEQ